MAWIGQVRRHFNHSVQILPIYLERGLEYVRYMDKVEMRVILYNMKKRKTLYNSSSWRDIQQGQENQHFRRITYTVWNTNRKYFSP